LASLAPIVVDTRYVDFDGHRIAYRVSGRGSALVVLNVHGRRADMAQARILTDGWRVFQVAPLGYGESDRVGGYTGAALPSQVLCVLSRHDVDRFVIWGYSIGGAMALCIARATPRAAGVVCGGHPPAPLPSGVMRQLDRRLDPEHPSRSLWSWYNGFDWPSDVSVMTCARLFYWGAEDRRVAERFERLRGQLMFQGVDLIEFPGSDHTTCSTPDELEASVLPAVSEWVSRRLGPSW
jgi:pimeloyl-ACP methyl ester carboxylesterase